MVFEKVKDILVDQLDVEEEKVTCLLYTSPASGQGPRQCIRDSVFFRKTQILLGCAKNAA